MIHALWQYVKQHPLLYVLGTICAIVSSLLLLIPNYIIQVFVDGIVESSLTGA